MIPFALTTEIAAFLDRVGPLIEIASANIWRLIMSNSELFWGNWVLMWQVGCIAGLSP
jgi:hypothetical protein